MGKPLAIGKYPLRQGSFNSTADLIKKIAAITIVPIRYVIDNFGYEAAFFWFGLIQGGVVFAIAWLLRGPEAHDLPFLPASKVFQSARSYSPSEVLKSPVFWLLPETGR